MWNELSYNKYDVKRKKQYTQNYYIDDDDNNNIIIKDNIIRYGTYEDLYRVNTFSVEEAFCCEDS